MSKFKIGGTEKTGFDVLDFLGYSFFDKDEEYESSIQMPEINTDFLKDNHLEFVPDISCIFYTPENFQTNKILLLNPEGILQMRSEEIIKLSIIFPLGGVFSLPRYKKLQRYQEWLLEEEDYPIEVPDDDKENIELPNRKKKDEKKIVFGKRGIGIELKGFDLLVKNQTFALEEKKFLRFDYAFLNKHDYDESNFTTELFGIEFDLKLLNFSLLENFINKVTNNLSLPYLIQITHRLHIIHDNKTKHFDVTTSLQLLNSNDSKYFPVRDDMIKRKGMKIIFKDNIEDDIKELSKNDINKTKNLNMTSNNTNTNDDDDEEEEEEGENEDIKESNMKDEGRDDQYYEITKQIIDYNEDEMLQCSVIDENENKTDIEYYDVYMSTFMRNVKIVDEMEDEMDESSTTNESTNDESTNDDMKDDGDDEKRKEKSVFDIFDDSIGENENKMKDDGEIEEWKNNPLDVFYDKYMMDSYSVIIENVQMKISELGLIYSPISKKELIKISVNIHKEIRECVKNVKSMPINENEFDFDKENGSLFLGIEEIKFSNTEKFWKMLTPEEKNVISTIIKFDKAFFNNGRLFFSFAINSEYEKIKDFKFCRITFKIRIGCIFGSIHYIFQIPKKIDFVKGVKNVLHCVKQWDVSVNCKDDKFKYAAKLLNGKIVDLNTLPFPMIEKCENLNIGKVFPK